MAKSPAFLFYSSDFLSGITDLTMEERGQYITLLCLQHQKGALSEKTIRLSLGSVSVDVLSKFQKDESGNYFNERLQREMQKWDNFTESRRKNGLLGGRPKKSEEPNGLPSDIPIDNANGKPSENLLEIENEIDNDIDNKKNKAPKKEVFMQYVKERCAFSGLIYDEHKELASAKYDAWFENGWKDLNGNKIQRWQSKVIANLPYFRKPLNGSLNPKSGYLSELEEKRKNYTPISEQ